MIKGGIGGANTNKNGLPFESKVKIFDTLEKAGYKLFNTNIDDKIKRIDYEPAEILVFEKHKLYKYLESIQPNYDLKEYVSAKLLPDAAIINQTKKVLKIIEVKYQETSGSTDEKLQTCDFKKKQYQKMVNHLGFKVEFYYILNDWFKNPIYEDVKKYIKNSGCDYFFNELPIDLIFN